MRRGLVGRRAASFAALILLAICCVLHIGILFWKQVRQDDIRHQEEIASPGAAFAPRMVPDAATFSAKDFVHVVVIFDAERTRHAMAMLTTVLLHAPSLTPVMLHIVTASSEYGLLESWMFWAKTKLSRTQDSLQLYDYGQCWELAGLVMHMSAPHVSLASHCKMFIPNILPEWVDKALYLDATEAATIAVNSISTCYRRNFAHPQYLGLVVDSGSTCQRYPDTCDWPIGFSYVVPGGLECGELPAGMARVRARPGYKCPKEGEKEPLVLNTGMMLMSLDLMRVDDFVGNYVNATVSTWSALGHRKAKHGERDFLNSFLRRFPNRLRLLHCGCNYQAASQRRQIVCNGQPVVFASMSSPDAAQGPQYAQLYAILFRHLECLGGRCALPLDLALPHSSKWHKLTAKVSEDSVAIISNSKMSSRVRSSNCCPHQPEVQRLINKHEVEPSLVSHGLGRTLYVITRTSFRPNFFADNQHSVDMQTYPHVVHVIVRNEHQVQYVDARPDPRCELRPDRLIKRNIIASPDLELIRAMASFRGDEPCPLCNASRPKCDSLPGRPSEEAKRQFTLCYCRTQFPMNKLMSVAHEHVGNGWVMYVDDDNLLADRGTVGSLLSYAGNKNVLYMFRSDLGRLTPRVENFGLSHVVRGDIDSANFMFHSKHLQYTAWGSTRCGDFRTVSALSARLPLKWLLSSSTVVQRSHPLRSLGGGHGKMPDFQPLTVATSVFQDGPRLEPHLRFLLSLLVKPLSTLILEVLLIWNGPEVSAPVVPGLKIVAGKRNSLNNRWLLALQHAKTEAILMLDDDVHVHWEGILCLYGWWLRHRDRLVGAFARRIKFDARRRKYVYVMSDLHGKSNEDADGSYNMVLPRAMVLSRTLLKQYEKMPEHLRDYVDTQAAHCDDVVLNAIVANNTGRPPVWVAMPAGTLVDCDEWGRHKKVEGYQGLGAPGRNRTGLRSECVNHILQFIAPYKAHNERMPMTKLVGVCDTAGCGKSRSDSLRAWSTVPAADWAAAVAHKEEVSEECRPRQMKYRLVPAECNLGVHWCDLLRSSGISDVDAAGVSRENGQWHYLGLSTKVASGSHHLQFCDKATLFCAGSHGNSCGTDIRQVMAVKTAIDNGGVHPRAP